MEKSENENDKNIENTEFTKVNKRKTCFKKVIITILIALIVLFIVHVVRNMLIFNNLKDKVENYADSTNYLIKLYSNNNLTYVEYYKKDNKTKFIYNVITKDGIRRKLTSYYDGEKYNKYIESDGKKVVILNTDDLLSNIDITNYFENDNFITNLFKSIKSIVTEEKVNNKKCYKIRFDKNWVVYIEKDTGLVLKKKKVILLKKIK